MDEYQAAEKKAMKEYRVPALPEPAPSGSERKVDKTSLISWKSNKYSVPGPWQKGVVLVEESGCELIIRDRVSNDIIARHTISSVKNQIMKNINHYRDNRKSNADREAELIALVGEKTGKQFSEVLRRTSPKIYKDQLNGLIGVIMKNKLTEELKEFLDELSQRDRLTTRSIRDHIEAWSEGRKRRKKEVKHAHEKPDLSAYAGIKPEKEVTYGIL